MNEVIPTFGKLTPRPYQWEAIQNIKQFIREQFISFKNGGEVKNAILNASVSSGKSLIMGAVAAHCQRTNHRCMILTDIGELCDQNGQEAWTMEVKTSFYSAYVGQKSNYYNVVSATLGTVANALNRDYTTAETVPKVLLIDECHKLPIDDMDGEKSSQYAQVIEHFKKINPALVVVGFTGTPYRGTTSILGSFWSQELTPVIDREFLKANGYTVPDVFGFTDNEYDLSEFNSFTENDTSDYSKADLERMQEKMDLSTTQKIMHDVIEMASNRNGVLVTCSGFKHAQEAASVLGDIPHAIFTTQQLQSNTGLKTRKEIVDAIKSGKIKYLFQIGCFSVGFSAPYIDTSVILRRIGSLTLLEQLLGRGRRLPNQWMLDAGINKVDHLVLDFSGTLEAMADLFNNPVLEDAMKAKDKKDNKFLHCANCGTEHGVHARRCPNEQCGEWFKFRVCEDLRLNGILVDKGCGVKNDIASKTCSGCGKYLIDPNASLSHKPYTDADWKPVQRMELAITGNRSDAIQVKYYLDSYGFDGKQEIATVNYWAIMSGGKRVWESKFVKQHVKPALWKTVLSMTPAAIVQSTNLFITPKMATHRINAKGESIVNVSKKDKVAA